MKTILIVDDEKNVRFSLETVFDPDYRVVSAANGKQALELAERESPDIAIVDLMMPGMSGLELLPLLHALDPRLTMIVLSAMNDVPNVVQAIKLGASHYLTKPFDVHEVRLIVEMALRDREKADGIAILESDISRWYDVNGVVGQSTAWQDALSVVRRAAEAPDTTVLLLGESGTGKELLARLLHKLSKRRDSLIPIHCAAIPEHLLESELFGHEKGSFTGATERRCGCIEMADGGSLFLDEIGEMPLAMQSKLLRFLQDHQFMRVGGRVFRQADVRVITATNRDLRQGVRDGWFREDLYYRLNVLPIEIPPLRDRHEDIPLLISHFLGHFRRERNAAMHDVSQEAMAVLDRYAWPGNVRELRNLVERVIVLSGQDKTLQLHHLPNEIRHGEPSPDDNNAALELPASLDDEIARIEKSWIQKALVMANGNLSQAAVLLRTTRRILKYKIDKAGLRFPPD